MQLGMVGTGRMGANLVRRLIGDGHQCVVFDRDPATLRRAQRSGAIGTTSLAALVQRLDAPRAVWVMVPHEETDATMAALAELLEAGDIAIDGGNSDFRRSAARAAELRQRRIHHLDVGTSGGIHGLERGFCLMIGGEVEPVRRLDPIFTSLAPGIAAAPRTPTARRGPRTRPTRRSTAEHGYLHCGPPGAGHFVKMVHNGIEYGLMAAYAEGFNLLAAAATNVGDEPPLPPNQPYGYDLDLASVAELWRRGSVVSSWLLDLTAAALAEDPMLETFDGHVSDSGEGRWAVQTAVALGVPVPVLSAALFSRFASQGRSQLANRLLSAMRARFGGHREPRR